MSFVFLVYISLRSPFHLITHNHIDQYRIPLENARLQDVPDEVPKEQDSRRSTLGGSDLQMNAFQIMNKDKSFVVIASTKEEKEDWMEDIKIAIDSILGESGAAFNAEDVAAAAVWQQDHHAHVCGCCDKEFNFILRRRHHCRACGMVVCDACSKGRRQLKAHGDSEQRMLFFGGWGGGGDGSLCLCRRCESVLWTILSQIDAIRHL